MSKLKGAISTQGYKTNSPDKGNDFNVIPGSDITMHGVNRNLSLYPVKFNQGHMQVSAPITAYPGNDYSFPDHDAVVEIPEFRGGGRTKGFPHGMTPLNSKLYNKIAKEAKKRFKVWPSPQVTTWINTQYKNQGGDYAFDYQYNYKQQGGDMNNMNYGIGPAAFYNYGGEPCYDCMQEGGNWLNKASESMERKGTKGAFTEYCGGTVTDECIERGLKSSNPTTRKRAGFAKAMRSIAKKEMGGDVPPQYQGLGDVVQQKNMDFINGIRDQAMMAMAAQEADAMAGYYDQTEQMMKQMGGEPQPVFDANMYNQEIYSQAAEPNNVWGDAMMLGNSIANMQMNSQESYVPQAQYGYSMMPSQYMQGNMLIPMNYAPYRPNPYYRMSAQSRNQTKQAPIAWDPSKTSALSSVEMKYGLFNKRSPRKVTLNFQTPYSKKAAQNPGAQPMIPVEGATGGADMMWQSSEGYPMPFQTPVMMDENQLQGRPIATTPEFKRGGLLKFMQLAGQVGLPFNPMDLANNPGAYNPYDPMNQQMYSPENTGTDYFQRNPMNFDGQTMQDNTSDLGEDDGYINQSITFKRKTAYNPEDVVNATYAGANFLSAFGENRQRKEYEKKLKQRMNADAVFTPLAMGMNSRGDYDINSGLFRPDETIPVQFRGNAGANYRKGGEYYMSEAEIQNFLRMGGQIELID